MAAIIDSEQPAAKRQKHTDVPYDGSIISESLLSEASRNALREAYRYAKPYTHCVMQGLSTPAFLGNVREEIISNVQATYKETDLFKVFQTGDLANLDNLDPEIAAKLPSLVRLKDALYSEDFRSFVRDVTGCGELSDKIDCSCNVYAPGGHLLCHDDVIGTRRVSYIVYLSEPEEPWSAKDGGALELYPLVEGQAHTPAATPTVCHLPTFNTMVMFTVLPGQSFHAVQEVFADDKPRMSISGWYHAPDAPENAEKASLQQLQLQAGEDAVKEYLPFAGAGSPSADLSDEDMLILLKYINPAYLSDSSWPSIQAKFAADGSIQLQNFLKKPLAEKILKTMMEEDRMDNLGDGRLPQYEAGAKPGSVVIGPPHKQRYVRYEGEPASTSAAAPACGPLLSQIRKELFSSHAFARLLHKMTSITFLGHQSEVRRFRPGLDYTVAHYGILTKDPRLDAVLCFVDDTSEDAAAAWNAGEVGGFEAYLLADEDAEGAAAAEVYRQDADESGVLNVSAAFNSLNLVLRDEGLMKFVKYVSFKAPSSRWDIAVEYQPEDDSDDEEEEEGGGVQQHKESLEHKERICGL